MRRVTLVIALAIVTPGCGLIVRGSDYLADAGQRSMDADVDGDVPRDGEPPPVDGEPPPIDGEVPGDAGPDAGPPVNRPPVASGIGLSNYAPLPGETLRAFVGPVHDADGDGVTTVLTWFKNGVELTDRTGMTLELDPSMFVVGDEIHVELSTEDADGPGSTATSGVAVVRGDDVTTWRLLLPPRSLTNMRAFDRARQRLLFWAQGGRDVADHGLWEMQLVTSGTTRWVRVDERGSRPEAVDGLALYDGENERILYYGGRVPASSGPEDSSDAVFALDLSERGRETWSQISVSAPPGRQAASMTLSADGARAWIYGGIFNEGVESGMRDDVWEVDLAEGRFTMVAASTGTPVIGAALIHDPERNRLIRVGGGPLTGEVPTPGDEIGAIDLETGAYTALGSLDSTLLGARGVVEGDSAYVFFGITGALEPSTQVLVVPLADPTEVTAVDAADAPFAILPSAESRAPFAEGWVVSGQGFDDSNADFYELDPTAASFTVITAAGHDLPTRTMQAISRIDRDGRMWIHGGRQGTREDDDIPVPDYLWRVTQNDTFERVTLSPAPTGGSNDPRWGTVWDGSQDYPWPDIWQVLGRTGTGYYGGEPVLLAGEGWRHLDLPDGAPGPDARVGHALFPGGCAGPVGGVTRGNVIGLFGGAHPESSQTFGDTWMLSCELPSSGAPINCAWSDSVLTAASLRPSPRAWAASAIAGPAEGERNRLVWLFGGRDASGNAIDEMWVLDNCVGPTARGEWVRGDPVAGSPTPNPRFGHSMSHVRVAAGAPASEPATILMYGGGQDESGHSNHPDAWRIVPAGPRGLVSYPVRYEPVTTTGAAPIGRMFHVAAWDHVQRRLLVYGGYAGERALDDLWELRIRP